MKPETQEDQQSLISCIEKLLNPKTDSEPLHYLKDLRQRIEKGCFDTKEPPWMHLTAFSDMDAEETDGPRFDLGFDGPEESKNLDLAKHYREERDELRLELEEMQKVHAMEVARLEAEYKAEIKALREDNEKFIRWPSKKRPHRLIQPGQSSKLLVFNINDVAAYVKERFSRSASEEICTMLYRFAVEYGKLSEKNLKLIDSIMPAIMKRDHPHQTFEFPNVTQFNNNPGKVING